MRTLPPMLTLALLALAMGACRSSQELDAGTGPTIGQTLDAFHRAASEADYEGYFALMHEDGVFLGTDATERWTKEEFMAYAAPIMLEQERGWTYRPRARRIHTDDGARVAWFDELLDHERYGELRGSGVLVMTPDGWRVMQYNLAFTVPNDRATGVVEAIGIVD